jgi:hypothetical protein
MEQYRSPSLSHGELMAQALRSDDQPTFQVLGAEGGRSRGSRLGGGGLVGATVPLGSGFSLKGVTDGGGAVGRGFKGNHALGLNFEKQF